MPFDAFDIPSVPCQNALAAFFERPDSDRRIVARRRESTVVGAERQPTDGFAVPRPRGQVVHIRLEVLDDAALICRRQVGTGVRELHGPHCAVMRLQDGLEIERQAIPERELSTRGTC